jgi:hypothetical protein
MASNWQVEARGLMSWSNNKKEVVIGGRIYSVELSALKPKEYEIERVEKVNDYSAKLTVRDPNNLVN